MSFQQILQLTNEAATLDRKKNSEAWSWQDNKNRFDQVLSELKPLSFSFERYILDEIELNMQKNLTKAGGNEERAFKLQLADLKKFQSQNNSNAYLWEQISDYELKSIVLKFGNAVNNIVPEKINQLEMAVKEITTRPHQQRMELLEKQIELERLRAKNDRKATEDLENFYKKMQDD